MKPKIAFVINTLPNQRCIKRIEEFIQNGYDVMAFTFVRTNMAYKLPENFPIEIIGEIRIEDPHYKRLKTLYSGLGKVKTRLLNEKNVYCYYFGLDIAMVFKLGINRPYFYEISDLSQTYVSNPQRSFLDRVDKFIVKNSFKTIVTSEGFIQYHFGRKSPENIHCIPNRVNKKCLDLIEIESTALDITKLKIGFVGFIRYKAVINFALIFAKRFPSCEFHFFGNQIEEIKLLKELERLDNIFFHGEFSNPNDLPDIYASINLVLSTYDTDIPNVKYAEPNKLYESIFFKTPIIVSRNTFLASKVEKLEVGYSIDAMDNSEIVSFINNLREEDIGRKIDNCKSLPLSFSIDENKSFFTELQTSLS